MNKKFWRFAWGTALLCLVPLVVGLLLWEVLPDRMVNHWNTNWEPDGWVDKLWGITAMPLAMFGGQWLLVGGLFLDRRNVGQNPKLLRVLLCILPGVSNFLGMVLYATALGVEISMDTVMMVLMGLLFVTMGNYLPKCRQNATLGIKLPWTLYNEENWNRTHRFGGKVFFCGGLVMVVLSLLPLEAGVTGLLAVIVAIAVLPTAYSWNLHRRQRAAGTWTQSAASVASAEQVRKLRWVGRVLVVLILIVVCFVCFTGNIDVVFGETAFTIDADFHEDMTVSYAAIDAAELCPEGVSGVRVWGFGSPRLLCGTFENEELGTYTRYSYTQCENAILLRSGEEVLVLSGKDAAETQALYEEILRRIP